MDTQPQNSSPMQEPAGNSSNHGMAILSYLGILIVIPFLTDAKNDPFVKFHLKQGLVLFVAEVVATFIVAIPVLGWIASPLIWLASLVLIIIGIMNAIHGKEKELPLVGGFAKHFNF